MKDFLLVSTGKAGGFNYQHDTIEQATAAATEEAAKGQECTIFQRYANVAGGEITLEKSDAVLQAEAAAEQIKGMAPPSIEPQA